MTSVTVFVKMRSKSALMGRREILESEMALEGKHYIDKLTQSALSMDLFDTTIPIGLASVRMQGPCAAEETSSRISFWWGITSAAIALAGHVQSIEEQLAGKQVIELGCGLGLAGIAAGLAGGNVLFTDYVRTALDFAGRNAALNGIPSEKVKFRILDWENADVTESFDLILGSEIVYDYFFHGCLIDILRRLVAPDGLVLLADRKRLCVSRFAGRLISTGFICTEIVKDVRVAGFPPQEITIFALRRG
jgi:predicted nicotinamide N-methyase